MKMKFLNESKKTVKKKSLTEAKKATVSKKLTEDIGNTNFSAYITNLGAYNEGDLIGKWLDFPTDEDTFNRVLKEIGIDEYHEEWFVTDYDADLDGIDPYHYLGEYPSFEELNSFASYVTDDAFKAILEYEGDFDNAVDVYDSNRYEFFPEFDNWADFARFEVENIGGLDKLPDEEKENCIDFESLGQDLDMDTYGDEDVSAGEYFCGDEDASYSDIGREYVNEFGTNGLDDYFDWEEYASDYQYGDGSLTDYGIIFIH